MSPRAPTTAPAESDVYSARATSAPSTSTPRRSATSSGRSPAGTMFSDIAEVGFQNNNIDITSVSSGNSGEERSIWVVLTFPPIEMLTVPY